MKSVPEILGAASGAAARSSAPSRKKCKAEGGAEKRNRKKSKEPAKDHRVGPDGKTVRYAKKPSQQVLERMHRALPGSGHRLFLIESKVVSPDGSPGGPVKEFIVLGATGNVYTVTISRHPACTCPDFQRKGNVCKHRIFVMLRVLGLDFNNPLVWQRALLKAEAETVLAPQDTAVAEGVMAGDAVQAQYRRLSSSGIKQGKTEEASQRPVEGDCPICFEPLKEEGEKITHCHKCGNHVHVECFAKWSKTKRAQCLELSCVYCRAPWPDSKPGATGDEYVNLAEHSTAHANMDQSLNALYGSDRARWIGRSTR